MKFLHTSDWHLGRQFHNVSLLDDQRYVLQQLLAMVDEQRPDAVIVAGDIYDRSVPPAAAVSLLDDTVHQLCQERGVAVILISGNHDSASRLSFGSRQMGVSGLHILADLEQVTTPVKIESESCETHFYAIPYCDPESVRNAYSEELKKTSLDINSYDAAHSFLVERIKSVMDPAVKNVLISHCFVDGAEASDSERPLSIGGADQVASAPMMGFDYVALGHLHSPQYRGAPHIRYSGSLLKYSFSEQHQRKSIALVDLSSDPVDIEQLPLQARRDVRVLEGELESLLALGESDSSAEDYLLVRLTDTHAILDPMGKLRQVYPNVLHLERPGLMVEGEARCARDTLKRGSVEMFKDFFTQVSGNPLTDEQSEALLATVNELEKPSAETEL